MSVFSMDTSLWEKYLNRRLCDNVVVKFIICILSCFVIVKLTFLMFLICFRCVEFMRGLGELHAPNTDCRHIKDIF